MTKRQTAELLAEEWGTVFPFPGFQINKPQLWEKFGGEWVEHSHEIDDVYELLGSYRFRLKMDEAILSNYEKPNPEALAIVSTGWGAPVEDCDPNRADSVAPSESKNRRRLALCVIVSRDASACSVLRFEDGGEELTIERMGTGSLAEAIDSTAFAVWGAEYVARLMVAAEQNEEKGSEICPEMVRALPLLRLMADEAEDDRQTVADRLETSLRAFLGGGE